MGLFGRRRSRRRRQRSGLDTTSTTPGGTQVRSSGRTVTPTPASMVAPSAGGAGMSATTAQPGAGAARSAIGSPKPLGASAPSYGASLDVPPYLQKVIAGGQLPMVNMAAPAIQTPIPTTQAITNKGASALDFRAQGLNLGKPIYPFQEGGMVGPGGVPMEGGAPMTQPSGNPPMTPEQMDGEMARTVQNDPQRIQALATELQNAIVSGELQAEQVNMGLQLAQSAVQDPSLYPQLREFALNNGLAEPEDLPMEYDEALAFVIILACRLALGMEVPGMGQPMQQGMPSMRSGGALPENSPNPGGGIPIMAHEGEYVIPKEVVARKGTEFFDKLIQANNGAKVS